MKTERKRATPWKEGKVISIQLRNGKYVLAQMVKEPYLVLFNLFNDDNIWKSTILSEDKILFCRAVVRQFIKYSPITVVKDVTPLKNYKLPTLWIRPQGFTEERTVKVNNKEYSLMQIYEYYSLVERDMEDHTKNTDISGLYKKALIHKITERDWDKVDGIEGTYLDNYPFLNERLYLCYLKGKNVNPLVDIELGKDIPDYYESYLEVMIGNEQKLGYE